MKLTAPALQAVPAGIVNARDHIQHALQHLPADVAAFLGGGAADGNTLHANERAWQDVQLLPRVLQPMAHSHTHCSLLGHPLTWPVLLAPVAHLHAAHPDGELATAFAANACETGMVLSAQSATPVEAVASIMQQDHPHSPLFFQMVWQGSLAASLALVDRATNAGSQAIVFTVDAPVQGIRDAELRHPLQLPAQWQSVHGQAQPAPLTQHSLCGGLAAVAPTWDDIYDVVQASPIPVILKGITHPLDAQQAQAIGAAAIIVSNHGGRTLDTVPATASLLPAIRQAVGTTYPVWVDGGIRRGTDIVKAIALGAHGVLIGRPHACALANAGARGVAHLLRQLRDELEAAMLLCGCAHIDKITSNAIR